MCITYIVERERKREPASVWIPEYLDTVVYTVSFKVRCPFLWRWVRLRHCAVTNPSPWNCGHSIQKEPACITSIGNSQWYCQWGANLLLDLLLFLLFSICPSFHFSLCPYVPFSFVRSVHLCFSCLHFVNTCTVRVSLSPSLSHFSVSHFSAVSHRAYKGPFLFSFSCPLSFLDLLFMSVRFFSRPRFTILFHVLLQGDWSYYNRMLKMACKSVVINIYIYIWLETRELSMRLHLCKGPNCSNLLSVERCGELWGQSFMFLFTKVYYRNVRRCKL